MAGVCSSVVYKVYLVVNPAYPSLKPVADDRFEINTPHHLYDGSESLLMFVAGL